MELDSPNFDFRPVPDARPRVVVPPPVWITAVADVVLPCPAGLERAQDAFYLRVLRFDPDPADASPMTYRAENVRLRFYLVQPPLDRDHFRPLQLTVKDLTFVRQALIDQKIPYDTQTRLHTTAEYLVLSDPAGNWLEITESRPIL